MAFDAAAKRLATIARNKAATREARLGEIDRQLAEGSLVIRQMTAAEREAMKPVAPGAKQRRAETGRS